MIEEELALLLLSVVIVALVGGWLHWGLTPL